jgi:hypothetical protein
MLVEKFGAQIVPRRAGDLIVPPEDVVVVTEITERVSAVEPELVRV